DAPEADAVDHLELGVPRVIDVASQGMGVGRDVQQRLAVLPIPGRCIRKEFLDLGGGAASPGPVDQATDYAEVASDGRVLRPDGAVAEEVHGVLRLTERELASEPRFPF